MNKLQLIDDDTLYYKPLAHPKMLIDGVLSDGLAILAGDSKIGKSWGRHQRRRKSFWESWRN